MRVSKSAKNMLKYLPVLAVLIATVIGLFIGRDLYPRSLVSQTKIPTQLTTEPDSPQPIVTPEAVGQCGFSNIYTSLPPKCKTFEGKFVIVPGTSSFILVTPEGK